MLVLDDKVYSKLNSISILFTVRCYASAVLVVIMHPSVCKAHWVCDLYTLLSKVKECSRSQAVTYAGEVIISQKWC